MKTSCKFLSLDCRLCVFYVSFQLKRNAVNVLRNQEERGYCCACCTDEGLSAILHRWKQESFRFENAITVSSAIDCVCHLFAPGSQLHGTRFHIVYRTLTYSEGIGATISVRLRHIHTNAHVAVADFEIGWSPILVLHIFIAGISFLIPVSTHAYAVIVHSLWTVLPLCVAPNKMLLHYLGHV